MPIIKTIMFGVTVLTVAAGIYSAVMNMPIITGCLNAECQLEKLAKDGINRAPTGDMAE